VDSDAALHLAVLVRGASETSGIKPPFSIALMCTTSRRIMANASTHQGPEKGDLMQVDSDAALQPAVLVRGARWTTVLSSKVNLPGRN